MVAHRRRGVFEHEDMKYPWFAPKMQVFESGEVQDMCGEDVSFCLMQKKQVLRSGAILVSELVTRRQELFDTISDSYTIIIKGEVRYKNLTQEEYFEYMDDLSIEYYQTGRPRPSDIKTKNPQETTNGNEIKGWCGKGRVYARKTQEVSSRTREEHQVRRDFSQ